MAGGEALAARPVFRRLSNASQVLTDLLWGASSRDLCPAWEPCSWAGQSWCWSVCLMGAGRCWAALRPVQARGPSAVWSQQGDQPACEQQKTRALWVKAMLECPVPRQRAHLPGTHNPQASSREPSGIVGGALCCSGWGTHGSGGKDTAAGLLRPCLPSANSAAPASALG